MAYLKIQYIATAQVTSTTNVLEHVENERKSKDKNLDTLLVVLSNSGTFLWPSKKYF